VIYRPETELASHYFQAVLPEQFDEFVWFDENEPDHAIRYGDARRPARHLPVRPLKRCQAAPARTFDIRPLALGGTGLTSTFATAKRR
jgi:hypothetical protein